MARSCRLVFSLRLRGSAATLQGEANGVVSSVTEVTVLAGNAPCQTVDGVVLYTNIPGTQTPPANQGPPGHEQQETDYNFTIFDVNLIAQGLDLENTTGHERDKTTIPWGDEETPGAYVHINCDDDNSDGDRDMSDPVVAGENDLLELALDLPPALPDVGIITLARSGGDVTVWSASSKGGANAVLTGTYVASTEGNGVRTWDLSNSTQRSDFNDHFNNHTLYVEGLAPNAVSVTLKYQMPGSSVTCLDTINYKPFGAMTGALPSAGERTILYGFFPHLVDCEWSVLAGASETYNCIAWSVGDTANWYDAVDNPAEPSHMNLDEDFGNDNGTFELVADLDVFYDDKDYDLLGGGSLLRLGTTVVYYSGYHACRLTNCPGMALVTGDLSMFSSKLGKFLRIEHVWDHLKSGAPPEASYGVPCRYYKEKP